MSTPYVSYRRASPPLMGGVWGGASPMLDLVPFFVLRQL